MSGGPTIYCCGRKTIALPLQGVWRCYWCSRRIRVVWPL